MSLGITVCRAVCPELAGTQVSLKEVLQARRMQRHQVRQGVADRLSILAALKNATETEAAVPARKTPVRLKRYYNE
jgi:hypothetical protein